MADKSTGLYGSDPASNMPRVVVSEIIGTLFLVFTGTSLVVAAILSGNNLVQPYEFMPVALGFGLILAAMVYGLGHISGAHFNPAVTLGLATTGRFPWKYVPFYIGAQIIGACLAALAVLLTFGSAVGRGTYLGATYPAQGVTNLRALFVEFMITFLLVLTIVAVATDKRVPKAAAGLAVGFALTAAIMIALPITGGAVNPARALGPMIVSGNLTSWWVYILGPVLGGVMAAVVYNRFLAAAEEPADSPE